MGAFQIQRLPNFCYRCGLLEHDLKDYLEESGNDKEEGNGIFNMEHG